MKFDFNRKYNTIAAYTLIVIAIGAAIVIGISNISQVGAFLSKIFSILTPFLWGFAIAYICLLYTSAPCRSFLVGNPG